MDYISEKIQQAYISTVVNPKEEDLMEEYLDLKEKAEIIFEKWEKNVKIQHTGEHEGKSVEQLKKEIAALKGKPGNKEKMGELLFALRSKEGWPKGKGSTGV